MPDLGVAVGLGKDAAAEFRGGKIATDSRGTVGLLGELYPTARDMQAVLERTDQLLQVALLSNRGAGLVKIANQADADAVSLAIGRTARKQLLRPALAKLEFAIGTSVAIADYEMVREPVGRVGHRFSASGKAAAVMDENVMPSAGFERDGGSVKNHV